MYKAANKKVIQKEMLPLEHIKYSIPFLKIYFYIYIIYILTYTSIDKSSPSGVSKCENTDTNMIVL